MFWQWSGLKRFKVTFRTRQVIPLAAGIYCVYHKRTGPNYPCVVFRAKQKQAIYHQKCYLPKKLLFYVLLFGPTVLCFSLTRKALWVLRAETSTGVVRASPRCLWARSLCLLTERVSVKMAEGSSLGKAHHTDIDNQAVGLKFWWQKKYQKKIKRQQNP